MDEKRYSSSSYTVVLCAIAFGLGAINFVLTAYFTEDLIGSPSSTSGLIFLFIPVLGLVGALGGGIVGAVFSFVPGLFKIMTITSSKAIRFGILFVIGFAFITGLAAFMVVRSDVKFNEPRIIYTDGSLVKEAEDGNVISLDNAIIPFEQRDCGGLVCWNEADIILSFPSDIIHAVDVDGDVIIQTSLSKFDYISELQAVEVKLSLSEKKYLAVLADLRATSNRTMLLIYSPSGILVYQEMLERTRNATMWIDELGSGVEVLCVNSKAGTFSYSPK